MKITAIFLFTALALPGFAQQYEVRKVNTLENWHVSFCESSYTRYNGERVFTYNVDSTLKLVHDKGLVTFYFVNGPVLELAVIIGHHVFEKYGDNFYQGYEISDNTHVASMSSDDFAKGKAAWDSKRNGVALPSKESFPKNTLLNDKPDRGIDYNNDVSKPGN